MVQKNFRLTDSDLERIAKLRHYYSLRFGDDETDSSAIRLALRFAWDDILTHARANDMSTDEYAEFMRGL